MGPVTCACLEIICTRPIAEEGFREIMLGVVLAVLPTFDYSKMIFRNVASITTKIIVRLSRKPFLSAYLLIKRFLWFFLLLIHAVDNKVLVSLVEAFYHCYWTVQC